MKNVSWKERKLDYLCFKYEEVAGKWENEHDDRIIVHNMFNMMIRAIKSLPDNPDNLVCVAMNNKISEYMKTMDDIMARFAGR